MHHAADESTARLARHGYLFTRSQYTVRDVLYGSIPVPPAAYRTLDAALFQRLKHLKQLGPAYLVYPGATHTRFAHSLGVYHLTRLALQHLTTQADLDPEVGRATLAAAMLHDIGHFPYSHVLDDLSLGGRRLSHTELGVGLVESDDELQTLLRDEWDVDPALVTDIMAGRENPRIPRFLYTLTDGPMDVDKLDYLNRDSHHSGVPYGRIEVQRLIECLAVDPDTGDLVIAEPGVGTVESVVFAKYLMFRYVYWHHTCRIAAAMINRAVLDCLLALGVDTLSVNEPRVRRVCMATDATLEGELRSMLAEAGVAAPPALSLLGRVDDRRLYKRAMVIPCAQEPEDDRRYRDSAVKRAKEAELAEQVSRALPTGSTPLDSNGVLIDVPPVAKFAVDVRGVLVDEGGRSRIEPWEGSGQASYLTADTVAGMERNLRSMLFLCDTHRPDGDEVQRLLTDALRDSMAGYSKRSLVEKLGIKPGVSVAVIDAPDHYDELIGEWPDSTAVSRDRLDGTYWFIHFFTKSRQELEERFPDLKAHLEKDGMLWVSWPKGASKIPTDVNENVVREIALAGGLVDVKVAAVDDVWSGLKLVYRTKDR